jgi:LCP family protein required for cell wall assembly
MNNILEQDADLQSRKRAKAVKRRRKRQRRRMMKIAGGVLIVLVLVGGATSAFFFREVHDTMNSVTEQQASLGDTFSAISPWANSPLDQTEGRTNILILGMRGQYDNHGGLLTDSIMIMSIDRAQKTATLISLPRDMYVSVPGYQQKYKLNRPHALGAQENPPVGVETAMQTVESVTDTPIHYGVRIDFIAFERIVNQLNGITVNVEKPLVDDNYGGLRVPAGEVDMHGQRARKYVQSRLSTSDFDRSRRQRAVVKAIKREMEQQGVFTNPQFVFNLMQSLEGNMKTTMSPQEIKEGLRVGKALDLQNMQTKGFTTSSEVLTSSKDGQGQYIIVPKGGSYGALQQTIDRLLASS